MVTEILSPLLSEHGIPLDGAQLSSLEKYAELLCEWNEKMNLTAITDPEGIACKHFLDSLAFLKKVEVPAGARLADVGKGAGFPGIVLKIARPDIELVLIDSLQKRLVFLDAVLLELGLSAKLVHARAEDAGHDKALRETFDVVTARAVANLSALSEYCLPLVKVGGIFAPMKTAEIAEEQKNAEKAISVLGGEILKTDIYELPVAGGRSIVTIRKTEHTPEKYPRQRIKIAEKPI